MILLKILILTLNIMTILATIANDNIVHTNGGYVQGLRDDGAGIVKFLNIPFAEPPVGHLRFIRPLPHAGWDGVRDATMYGPTCLQTDRVGVLGLPESEDCLQLNIFVPLSTSPDPLPVMIYIFGGSYVWGSGVWYDGTRLATLGEVIVVTINYRLGMLGWLSSGTRHMPGNMGFFDQNLAMVWVNENIGYFGGDPNQVTLFGVSAGADSIIHHILSPMSSGLFQRVALESPPAQFRLPDRSEQFDGFRELADVMGCNQSRTRDIIGCLQLLPADLFKQSLYRSLFPDIDGEQVTRVIDRRFVRRDPKVSWEKGLFEPADVLIGFNSDDANVIIRNGAGGLGIPFDLIVTAGLPGGPFQLLDLIGQTAIGFQTRDRTFSSASLFGESANVPNAELLMTMLRHEYFQVVYANPTDKALELRTGFDVCTAGVFGAYATYIANTINAHPNTTAFMYLFSYRSPQDVNPSWLLDHGAFHSDEVDYLWEFKQPVNEVDQGVIDAMKNVWTSFGKTGRPMVNGTTPFPQYFNEERKFWHFSEANSGMGEETIRVWDSDMNFFNNIIQPVADLKESCRKPRPNWL